MPPRLAAKSNADAVRPALGAVAVTLPLGRIAKPVTLAKKIPAEPVSMENASRAVGAVRDRSCIAAALFPFSESVPKRLGFDLLKRHLFGTPMATGRTGDPAPPLLLSGKIIVQEVHTLSSARDFRFAFWI